MSSASNPSLSSLLNENEEEAALRESAVNESFLQTFPLFRDHSPIGEERKGALRRESDAEAASSGAITLYDVCLH